MPQPEPGALLPECRSRLFKATELVYPQAPNGPRFGDSTWDVTPLARRTNQPDRGLTFTGIPASWVLVTRETLMIIAQPDHPQVMNAGVVRRAEPAPLDTLLGVFRRLRAIAAWSVERDLNTPARWTQDDADALLADLRAGRHRDDGEALAPSTIRQYVATVKMLRTFGPALTDGGLPFQPWGARSPARVAEWVKQVENTTSPLRWDTWAPAVSAAWAFIDRFSADILSGVSAADSLPKNPHGPSGRNALDLFWAWEADGGRVPLHTGVGRSSAPRGEPNTRLLCRQIGINSNIFTPCHHQYSIEATEAVARMVRDPERSTFGGIHTPTVSVILDDGTATPWIDEIGIGELNLLVSILRGSGYVLLASLTGMRDSEIQELTRDASTTSDGLPALASVQYKGEEPADGRPRSWYGPPPVFRALEILSALSRHATHIFARSETNAGEYVPQRDIPRLIAFVNDDPRVRPGRGRGLGLKTIQPTPAANINQSSLRRSFCVYAARYPGAELGLGIQLGHAALRTTTGYMTDSQQRTARLFDEDRQDIAREQVAALIIGAAPVSGAPKAELSAMRAQVLADPGRAERVINAAGERYHLGFFNDCLWNKARSGCGPDGPHLAQGVCKGAACGNALFRQQHLPSVAAHVERLDAFLDSGRGHPALLEDLRKQRALYSRVISDIQTDTLHKDD